MIEPKTVRKETVYYSITLFKYRNQYGRTLKTVYPSLEHALKVYTDIIKRHCNYSVILREETVYQRTKSSELSASTPIAKYENNYTFSDLIMDMKQ